MWCKCAQFAFALPLRAVRYSLLKQSLFVQKSGVDFENQSIRAISYAFIKFLLDVDTLYHFVQCTNEH